MQRRVSRDYAQVRRAASRTIAPGTLLTRSLAIMVLLDTSL